MKIKPISLKLILSFILDLVLVLPSGSLASEGRRPGPNSRISSKDLHRNNTLTSSKLPVPPYCIGSFYWGSTQKHGSLSRPTWDISTLRMRDRLFTRLEQVGINMLTYAYVYRESGPVYPNNNPRLKTQVKLWLGHHPVKDFLEECGSHHIAGYLGLALEPAGLSHNEYFNYLKDITADVITRFKKYPGFKGFVPPVESRSPNLSTNEFSELADTALKIKPDLDIMDFPNGPFPSVVRTILNHINSGTINIENVQFYIGDFSEFSYFLSDYREMEGFRGLTDFMEGLTTHTKVIIHTHYMNGFGEHAIPRNQTYRVSQGVLLTATTYGIHFFDYFNLFNGYDVLTHRNAFWRWTAWCKGVLSVQRYAPFYADSKLIANVTAIVPRKTGLGGTDFVNRAWTPFAVAHIPQNFAANLTNVHSKIWIVPSPIGLSEKQVSSITKFVKNGGILITVLDPKRDLIPNPNDDFDFRVMKYTVGEEADQIRPAYQKLLRVNYSHYVEDSVRFSSRFSNLSREKNLTASGFELKDGRGDVVLARWSNGKPAVILRHIGRGLHFIIPGGLPFLAKILPLLVRENMKMPVAVRNLPSSYILERYQTKGPYGHTLFLILGSKEGSTAKHVRLDLPSYMRRKYIVYFDDSKLHVVRPEVMGKRLVLRLPTIRNYGALVIADNTFPVLHPDQTVRYVSAGSKQEVSVSLFNALSTTIRDTLTMTLPGQWNQTTVTARKAYTLLPGEQRKFWFDLTVPSGVEHDTYFIHFATLGLTQRMMIVPVNGKPRLIMHGQIAPNPLPPRGKIGYDWVGVTAGERGRLRYGGIAYVDNNEFDHDPGVSFYYNGQWSHPRTEDGTTFRTGTYSTLRGGPRFWIDGLDTRSNYEIKVAYEARYSGELRVWNGSFFHSFCEIPGSQHRDILDCILPAGEFADAGGTGNVNALLEFHIPQISVTNIEVRRVPATSFARSDSLRNEQ